MPKWAACMPSSTWQAGLSQTSQDDHHDIGRLPTPLYTRVIQFESIQRSASGTKKAAVKTLLSCRTMSTAHPDRLTTSSPRRQVSVAHQARTVMARWKLSLYQSASAQTLFPCLFRAVASPVV